MEALLVGLLAVIVLALILVAVVFARRWVWRPVVASRVIVQLDNDMAISGVLLERRGPLLVLADAQVHTSNQAPVKADGRAVVERSRVVWIQAV